MWPIRLDVFGMELAIWDLMFLVAVVVGYAVLRIAVSTSPSRPLAVETSKTRLLVAYLLTVYVAALGAQTFSYAFDAGTTLLSPSGVSPWRYYLHPAAGPKTLYGCILALPIAIALVRLPPLSLAISFRGGLDLWTPPMLAVLAVVRVGCFLQGCCYGVRSEVFGLRFAERSIVYHEHVARGLMERGAPMAAVIPTQLLEAVFLSVLFGWSIRAVARGHTHVFATSVTGYSVFRFAVELVRDDPARNALGPLSTSQWVAAAVVVGVVALRRASR